MNPFQRMAWVVSACVLACCAAEKPPAGPDTREAGWRSLFNGKDLAGWEPQGKAHWRVEDGVIVGTQDGNPSLSGLLTTKEGELVRLQASVGRLLDEPTERGEGAKKLDIALRGVAEDFAGFSRRLLDARAGR